MKATFLKSKMTFAVVAVMGISGAFLTTSMQSSSEDANRDGYINSLQERCNVRVDCSDIQTTICQASGQQAFGKGNNCTEVLYKRN